ncbi:hypothetical protein BCAR13_590063 [Paraburkholderia caribensis]|nr:hypothetical protein BCAR13_590063 [Paraburkholderia caribensis]
MLRLQMYCPQGCEHFLLITARRGTTGLAWRDTVFFLTSGRNHEGILTKKSLSAPLDFFKMRCYVAPDTAWARRAADRDGVKSRRRAAAIATGRGRRHVLRASVPCMAAVGSAARRRSGAQRCRSRALCRGSGATITIQAHCACNSGV